MTDKSYQILLVEEDFPYIQVFNWPDKDSADYFYNKHSNPQNTRYMGLYEKQFSGKYLVPIKCMGTFPFDQYSEPVVLEKITDRDTRF